ncbi:MAG: class I SAM-dependent methyltransferase [Terriglobia bacterium]
MRSDWSYDSIADDYNRVLAPRLFEAPARDLIAAVGIDGARLVLDVGTGTGRVASAAQQGLADRGSVLGLDRSLPMLRFGRENGVRMAVVAHVPGIPFPPGSFDVVVSGFVISHFGDHRAALLDMVRVIRPGGRLGASAWQASDDEFMRAWKEVARSFVDLDRVGAAAQEAIPGEERFSRPEKLRASFEEAGLHRVSVEPRSYRYSMSIDEFLHIQEYRATGRLMRERVGEDAWRRFRDQIAATFRARFRPPVEYTRQALIAVGVKP